MENYSLSLALFDYIPVLLSIGGLWLLAGGMGRSIPGARVAALLAVVLIGAGGLSKATWKLTWVLSTQDIVLLNNLLFILMAPGFVLLACHVTQVQAAWRNPASAPPDSRRASQLAVILALLVLGAAWLAARDGSRAWFFVLLGTASLGNIVVSGLLIRYSWGRGQRATAGLFLLSICLVLALGNLSRFSEGSAPLQWLAEVLNTLAHGSFALAVWRLLPEIPNRPSAVPIPQT